MAQYIYAILVGIGIYLANKFLYQTVKKSNVPFHLAILAYGLVGAFGGSMVAVAWGISNILVIFLLAVSGVYVNIQANWFIHKHVK